MKRGVFLVLVGVWIVALGWAWQEFGPWYAAFNVALFALFFALGRLS